MKRHVERIRLLPPDIVLGLNVLLNLLALVSLSVQQKR